MSMRKKILAPFCDHTLLSISTINMLKIPFILDIYPYSCQECGKKFRTRSNLDVHMRVHNGDLPFICEQCGKAFRYQFNLHVHRQTHSAGAEDSSVKPYSCQVCGRSYRSKILLSRHVKDHQQIVPYNCAICR